MNFPLRPFSSNLTTPVTSAKSVSSEPRPTPEPGLNFVPRCRTRISPPRTLWPPNRLTPNRWAFESRPLRELPTPFLCAIFHLRKFETRTPRACSGVYDLLIPTLQKRLRLNLFEPQ